MKKAIVDKDPHSLYLIGVMYLYKDRERGLYYLKGLRGPNISRNIS